jgi:hypothetical protein
MFDLDLDGVFDEMLADLTGERTLEQAYTALDATCPGSEESKKIASEIVDKIG